MGGLGPALIEKAWTKVALFVPPKRERGGLDEIDEVLPMPMRRPADGPTHSPWESPQARDPAPDISDSVGVCFADFAASLA